MSRGSLLINWPVDSESDIGLENQVCVFGARRHRDPQVSHSAAVRARHPAVDALRVPHPPVHLPLLPAGGRQVAHPAALPAARTAPQGAVRPAAAGVPAGAGGADNVGVLLCVPAAVRAGGGDVHGGGRHLRLRVLRHGPLLRPPRTQGAEPLRPPLAAPVPERHAELPHVPPLRTRRPRCACTSIHLSLMLYMYE